MGEVDTAVMNTDIGSQMDRKKHVWSLVHMGKPPNILVLMQSLNKQIQTIGGRQPDPNLIHININQQ